MQPMNEFVLFHALFTDTYELFLISVCIPCESDAAADADEFRSVLADSIAVIDQLIDHCFELSGDFNIDFNTLKAHSRLLRNICNDNDLRFATYAWRLLHRLCIKFQHESF